MQTFSRRGFLKQAGVFVALSELLLPGENAIHANPLGLPFGCQTAAKAGGIKNYFVEMDLPLMKASLPYLHQLQV